VLATALVTVIASYFYLGGNVVADLAQSPAAHIGGPALATASIVLGALAIAASVRSLGREPDAGGGRETAGVRRRGLRPLALRVTLLAAFALAAAHLGLLLDAWFHSGLAPAADGRHSAFLGVAGFQGVVAAVLLAMVSVALIWAVARPRDARGHATVWNAALVYAFAAVSGAITFAALYLVPRAG
ncbi:MAG: hypothetical protein M3Q93_09480, partial [Gemmatimonadota bacterium]|nr:hypothetical protein [Gemmatimonadota bacterium]